MQHALTLIKNELATLQVILADQISKMAAHNSVKKTVPSAIQCFNDIPSFVQLDDNKDEFYATITPHTKKSLKTPGRVTARSLAIRQAINQLSGRVRSMLDYKPFFLTDEDVGVSDNACDSDGGIANLSNLERCLCRQRFKCQLAKGLESVTVNVFGRLRVGGGSPSCVVVWKVPYVCGDDHSGNVQRAMQDSRQLIPKRIITEAARHLNEVLNVVADVPAAVRKVIANYVFGGEVNLVSHISDKYSRFVENLSAGLPVDESMIIDGRQCNSRGGLDAGITKFDKFWEACRR